MDIINGACFWADRQDDGRPILWPERRFTRRMLTTLVKLDSRVSDMSMPSKVAPCPKVDSNSSSGKIHPRGGRLRGSAWSDQVDLVKAPKHAGRESTSAEWSRASQIAQIGARRVSALVVANPCISICALLELVGVEAWSWSEGINDSFQLGYCMYQCVATLPHGR